MKYIYMIYAVLISCSGINAMKPDRKMDMHRKRCKDDLNKSMMYMTMNCSPFLFKEVRQNKTLFPIVSFLAIAQGYFLYDRFMTYRSAQRGIIEYKG